MTKTITLKDLLAATVDMGAHYVEVSNFEFFGIKPVEVDADTAADVLFDMDVKREESESEPDEELFEIAYYRLADGTEVEALSHRIGDRNFTVFGDAVFEEVDAE